MARLNRSEPPPRGKRILEINPDHPAVAAVRDLYEKSPKDPRVGDYVRLLYEQAVIAEGSETPDPAAFAQRINALIARDAARPSEE